MENTNVIGIDCLIDYWEGRCALTGFDRAELLRARHMKPWAGCEADAERLDIFNGLLLAPHLAAVFETRLLTIADDGSIVVSAVLSSDDCVCTGIVEPLGARDLTDQDRAYLTWHRLTSSDLAPEFCQRRMRNEGCSGEASLVI